MRWLAKPDASAAGDQPAIARPTAIASPSALVREKLRAASDPARRESKRFQDLTDAKSLAEDHPEVEKELTSVERALLNRTL